MDRSPKTMYRVLHTYPWFPRCCRCTTTTQVFARAKIRIDLRHRWKRFFQCHCQDAKIRTPVWALPLHALLVHSLPLHLRRTGSYDEPLQFSLIKMPGDGALTSGRALIVILINRRIRSSLILYYLNGLNDDLEVDRTGRCSDNKTKQV